MVSLGTQPSNLARKADVLGENQKVRPLLDIASLELIPTFIQVVLPFLRRNIFFMLMMISDVELQVVDIFQVTWAFVGLP